MKRPFYLNNVSYVTVTKFRLLQVLYSISALKDPELRFFYLRIRYYRVKNMDPYGKARETCTVYTVQVHSYMRTGTVPAVFVKIHSLFCRWSYCSYRSVNRNRTDVEDPYIYLFFRLLRFTLTTAS
jgi:hypothetical protein